ncbi:MAG: DUF2130 domain-containing protein, partial [Planctomycetes bacterium]|nr:DUF2130 domain-containing protein [Planctomycetota bacterium]
MSDANKIVCPNCSHEFEITEVLSRKIKAEHDVEMHKLRTKLEQQQVAMNKDREKHEKSLLEQEKIKQELKKQFDEQVIEELKSRERHIKQELREEMLLKAKTDFSLEKEELEKELANKNKKLQEAQKTELELRKRERKLESRQESFDLELERKLGDEKKKMLEENKKLRDEISKQISEQEHLKMLEKDDQIKSLRDQIRELQRRSDVGSQEAQGEALEKDLLIRLQAAFPHDLFEEVKKGERGHDITQTVCNNLNRVQGTIIWEAKNTKTFNNGWIDKLKEDLQRKNADCAMLVTIAMPKNVDHFEQIDNIWVTNYKSAFSICAVLRQSLTEITQVKATEEYRDSMKDTVYNYITGVEFKRHLNNMFGAFKKMKADFEKEKNAMLRYWKQREKSIETIITSVVSFDGDISGYLALDSQKPIIEGLT